MTSTRSSPSLTGQRVLVLDGASGIGAQIARAFHECGASVAASGAGAQRGATGAPSAARGPIALSRAATGVSETGGIVAAAIATLGGLDVLVCATSRAAAIEFERVSVAHWEEVLRLNLKIPFFAAQASLPELRKSRGCIINVASVIGLLGGPRGSSAFATAKGAMVQMSRMMALELAADGIRVNTVCLSWIDPLEHGAEESRVFADYLSQRSPLGRLPSAEECIGAILQLASPGAGYTTGAVLAIDGGLSSGHYLS
jgi:NAD(P)-dependent dehydrogenase (short-subunit alcohol dehydrogenase family)